VARVPARKSGRVDSRYRNIFVVGVKQVHRFSEGETKIESFLSDCFHVSDFFNEFPIVLIPVIFEENEDEKLMLDIDLF